jgi:hypothetical protein
MLIVRQWKLDLSTGDGIGNNSGWNDTRSRLWVLVSDKDPEHAIIVSDDQNELETFAKCNLEGGRRNPPYTPSIQVVVTMDDETFNRSLVQYAQLAGHYRGTIQGAMALLCTGMTKEEIHAWLDNSLKEAEPVEAALRGTLPPDTPRGLGTIPNPRR